MTGGENLRHDAASLYRFIERIRQRNPTLTAARYYC
jgi:hypothetical protein